MANTLAVTRIKNWSYYAQQDNPSQYDMFYVENKLSYDQDITEIKIYLGYGSTEYTYGNTVKAGDPYKARLLVKYKNDNEQVVTATSEWEHINKAVGAIQYENGDSPNLNHLIKYTFVFKSKVPIKSGEKLTFVMECQQEEGKGSFVVVRHNQIEPAAEITSDKASYEIIYMDQNDNEIQEIRGTKVYGDSYIISNCFTGYLYLKEDEENSTKERNQEYKVQVTKWINSDGLEEYLAGNNYEKNSNLILKLPEDFSYPQISLPNAIKQGYKFLG